MRILLKITGLLIICFLLFSRCETTDCITFSSRFVSVQFLDTATSNPKAIEFSLITAIDSEVIFYSDTLSSQYYLPVNTDSEQTTFLFLNIDNSIDTLSLIYDKKEKLISEDCGFDLLFNNVEIEFTTFNKAESLGNDLSRLNEENIKIYH